MNRTFPKRMLWLAALLILCVAGLYAEELVQVALLLDTSSSMDGLIEQAKTQLWKIINELATAKRNGASPAIEVALYEYGNNNLASAAGWIRNVLPLTRDLDKVSEALFALTTYGGSEFCGTVIQRAAQDLGWQKKNDILKLVYIAGNEPFNQGSVDFRASCKEAIAKGIIINTIFCGHEEEGRRTFWAEGAALADGRYFSIDQNAVVASIKAPQDDEILRLNSELNRTYLAYGVRGKEGKTLQEAQDTNAAGSGGGIIVERSLAKSKAQYTNESWDLVDAYNKKTVDLENLPPESLPPELKGKSTEEQRAYLAAKTKEREGIQQKLKDLEKDRRAYIEKERAAQKQNSTLDTAIITSLRDQAAQKNYRFEN